MNISFFQLNEDWHEFDKKELKKEAFDAKKCNQRDFGNKNEAKEFYKVWSKRSIFCIDFEKDNTNFLLSNHSSDESNQHVTFSIERCRNSSLNLNSCYPDQKIDNFLRDVSVEGWSIHNHLDFTGFNKEPQFKLMEIEFQNLLSAKNF